MLTFFDFLLAIILCPFLSILIWFQNEQNVTETASPEDSKD